MCMHLCVYTCAGTVCVVCVLYGCVLVMLPIKISLKLLVNIYTVYTMETMQFLSRVFVRC